MNKQLSIIYTFVISLLLITSCTKASQQDLNIEKDNVEIATEGQTDIKILSGSGQYSVESNNTGVNTIISGDLIVIEGKTNGEYTLTIKDIKTQQTKQINVSVVAPYAEIHTLLPKGSAMEFLAIPYNQDAWVDINGNEKKDADEEIKNNRLPKKFTLDQTKFKIYGNIKELYFIPQEISYIDVSKLPALVSLQCEGNKALSSIDISSNMKLKSAYLAGNGLISLLLPRRDNNVLENITCPQNQIEALDPSHCPNLYWLECNKNQLTTLDLSKNTELMTLFVQYNNLTSLDVSNCFSTIEITKTDETNGETYKEQVGLKMFFSYKNNLKCIKISEKQKERIERDKYIENGLWKKDDATVLSTEGC
ncbi:MAG: hypothetical protein CSA89_01450 [Bacteroidales bacterium]|nr:MAG: hypothetical protein CSA89_01450 [Bacteroidales bacterium]